MIVAPDADLLALVDEYNRFQRAISETAFSKGERMSAVDLHHLVYYAVPAALPSQMKCSAIRNVAGAYASARRNHKPAAHAFDFKSKSALFLENKDFSFTKDGKLSISTAAGRKRLTFRVPDYAKSDFDNAVSKDCIVVAGAGRITLCVTLEVPEAMGINPVGIDLGVKNALVASTETDTLFVSGLAHAVHNRRTRQTRQRLQGKLAARKAVHTDTRGVRRVLKRLGRKQHNRNRTFCRETAARLCKWAPKDAVLVFEDLRFKQVRKGRKRRKGTTRKISSWFFRQMTQACTNRAQRDGLAIAYVDPAYTSQRCRKCGLLGIRQEHKFACACGHVEHADINASHNIRLSYAVLRSSGHQSMCPEALPSGEGKPSALASGR